MGTSDQPIDEVGIADYDVLTAKAILTQLAGLDQHRLKVLREHEAGHKGRVSVLRRLDALVVTRASTGAEQLGSENHLDAARVTGEIPHRDLSELGTAPVAVGQPFSSQPEPGYPRSADGRIGRPADGGSVADLASVDLGSVPLAGRAKPRRRLLVAAICILSVLLAGVYGIQKVAAQNRRTISALIITSVESDRFRIAKQNDSCVGDDVDVHTNAVFSIQNETRDLVASGRISIGLVEMNGTFPACIMLLKASVPKASEYHIRVGRKDGPTYSYQELVDEEWSVILGDDLDK